MTIWRWREGRATREMRNGMGHTEGCAQKSASSPRLLGAAPLLLLRTRASVTQAASEEGTAKPGGGTAPRQGVDHQKRNDASARDLPACDRRRSRRGWDTASLLPELSAMPGSATLDGELVAFGPDGAPDVGLAGTPDLTASCRRWPSIRSPTWFT